MSNIEYLDYRIEKVLITEEQIKERIKELGKQITKDFKGKELTVVSILRGSFLFTADLCRSIDLDQKLDFMAVSSYGNATKSSGVVKVEKDWRRHLRSLFPLLRTHPFITRKDRRSLRRSFFVCISKKSRHNVCSKYSF